MQCALLSVVIPFYNAKSTVLRAARSVVNQPCAETIELLLMDDGSKDEGGRLCDPFLFWLRAKFFPGFTLAVKRFLYKTPVLMILACFVRYRLRLHWKPFDRQQLS